MGINDTLLNGIGKDIMSNYGLNYCKVGEFMGIKTDFPKKQEKALEIIEFIMEKRKKRQFLPYLKELARVEYGAREFDPRMRDHVVHALLSFILGIYIYEKFLSQKVQVPDFEDFRFQWQIAGPLHDIGYPLEVASNIMRSFTKKINCLKNKNKKNINKPCINIEITPIGLVNLIGGCNSLDLIQECLCNWYLSSIDAKKEYEQMIKTGKVRHGIIGSLAVLYVIDLLYKEKSWCRKDFYKDIVPACSAIFIHDLPPECECSKTAKIDPSKAPLAFLLRLSDCLQDWERPLKCNLNGFSDDQYDIDIDGCKLIFTIKDKDQYERIKEEIDATLEHSSKIEIKYQP